MSYVMRLTVICWAIVLVGCGEGRPGVYRNTLLFVPTETVNTQILPAILPLTTVGTVICPTPSALTLTTSFDLVVIAQRPSDMRVDSATFRLITGESVGGPSITFPSTQLTQMFGTTAVGQTRVFAFRPEFNCHVGRPQSIAADVILIDSAGNPQTHTTSAVFQ